VASEWRKAMVQLHSWAGVILGSLLFSIFWMGSLSLFDEEIDRWMMPDTRHLAPVAQLDFDRLRQEAAAISPANASRWQFILPTERNPSLRLTITADKTNQVRELDPANSRLIPDQGTKGATGFIFPFHFSLTIKWKKLGYWIVGVAGMGMLVILVAGVIAHRKFFAEFFTFRAHKKIQRSSLDLHNLTGAVALPFHFIIAFSGLVIFMGTYFPTAHQGLYGDQRAAYEAEAQGKYTRPKLGTPATPTSLNTIVAQAREAWRDEPLLVRIWHPGDANSYVEIRRSFARDITMNLDQLYIDAVTGQQLARFEAAPVMRIQRFISGLHFVQFEHWPLRFFYFICGLAGCLTIVTGLIFWVEARRKSHTRHHTPGLRLVEGLTVGGSCGIIVATLVFLIANRLLPLAANWAGQGRASLEILAFFSAWLLVLAAAWAWPARAWYWQTRVIALLALVAVLLNGVTTGDYLWCSLAQHNWAIAGVDAGLLITFLIALSASHHLGKAATIKNAIDNNSH
jgi:uncharacterized iron-regulated membrane protein